MKLGPTLVSCGVAGLGAEASHARGWAGGQRSADRLVARADRVGARTAGQASTQAGSSRGRGRNQIPNRLLVLHSQHGSMELSNSMRPGPSLTQAALQAKQLSTRLASWGRVRRSRWKQRHQCRTENPNTSFEWPKMDTV